VNVWEPVDQDVYSPHRCKERTNWNFRRFLIIKWLTVFFTMQYNKKNLSLSFPMNR
jgi:hypothetical protein